MNSQSPETTVPTRAQSTTFVVLTFIISWPLWGAAVHLVESSMLRGLFTIGGAFGPALAALAVWRYYEGTFATVKRQLTRWSVGIRWWLLTLVLPVGIFIAGLLGASLIGVPIESRTDSPAVAVYPVVLAASVVLFGGNEEIGWRGLMLPALQTSYGALGASVIVGVVWALWHAPLFMFSALNPAELPYVVFVVGIVALSILHTLLYHTTGQSVLVVAVFHAGFNATLLWLPESTTNTALTHPYTMIVAVQCLVAIGVVVLTRGTLGSRELS